MSLNKMNLPPYMVAQLYHSSLVGSYSNPAVPAAPGPDMPETAVQWKHLGSNQKNIMVVVYYSDSVHLPDLQLEFLTQLLKACRLSLNDVSLINMNNYAAVAHTSLLNHFNSKVILLFGITVQDWGFPFQTPPYQVQSFSGYSIMHAPALQELQNDKAAKGLLWTSLKHIFHL